jgi:hypothetical protein
MLPLTWWQSQKSPQPEWRQLSLVGSSTFTPTTSGGRITGGSVTTDPAIPATSTILFKRVTPKTQTLDFTAGGSFEAEAIESTLDKIVMIAQEVARDFGVADTALDTRITALEP